MKGCLESTCVMAKISLHTYHEATIWLTQCLLNKELGLPQWMEVSLSVLYSRDVSGCRREVVSERFTKDRLQGIAQKLDIAHGGAFDVGLTWLAPPDVILDLAEETVIIGR